MGYVTPLLQATAESVESYPVLTQKLAAVEDGARRLNGVAQADGDSGERL